MPKFTKFSTKQPDINLNVSELYVHGPPTVFPGEEQSSVGSNQSNENATDTQDSEPTDDRKIESLSYDPGHKNADGHTAESPVTDGLGSETPQKTAESPGVSSSDAATKSYSMAPSPSFFTFDSFYGSLVSQSSPLNENSNVESFDINSDTQVTSDDSDADDSALRIIESMGLFNGMEARDTLDDSLLESEPLTDTSSFHPILGTNKIFESLTGFNRAISEPLADTNGNFEPTANINSISFEQQANTQKLPVRATKKVSKALKKASSTQIRPNPALVKLLVNEVSASCVEFPVLKAPRINNVGKHVHYDCFYCPVEQCSDIIAGMSSYKTHCLNHSRFTHLEKLDNGLLRVTGPKTNEEIKETDTKGKLAKATRIWRCDTCGDAFVGKKGLVSHCEHSCKFNSPKSSCEIEDFKRKRLESAAGLSNN